jgi:endonuclease/exonuclease/phosphatase family metal-dependent hydrolase
MKAVVWNMAHKVPNWAVLSESPDLQDADVYLLSEASPAPPGVVAVGHGSTEGLEVALGSAKAVKRTWSTAVATKHPVKEIKDARTDRYYGELLPFQPSRLGTWSAALVDVNGLKVTAISLYGLMDERSDASVHRSLSELSPVFDHTTYGKHLLLGGDLNILANPRSRDPVRERHSAVLARIRAYGLVDCLEQALRAQAPPRGGLENCPCGLGAGCMHTWTKRDPQHPTVPYQDDYLFASRALANQLFSCVALPLTKDSPSDHAPIVATFELK